MESDDYYDENDYILEYSEESASDSDVDLENQYYLAKSLKDDDLRTSLEEFERVLEVQNDEKTEWGFRALKQLVKMNFQLNNYDETIKKYKQLLNYTTVTKNRYEKAINSILDFTSTSKNMTILQQFYEITLDTLKITKNERLWFKTNIKLGKVYLECGEYMKLLSIIKQLRQIMCLENNGTQLLEVYALEIQMYTEQKNYRKLKTLYGKCSQVKSAIPHPLTMSIIRECGGKMHLRAKNYKCAYKDFFEAFKNYDESGNIERRLICLKYLLLTSMLMKSDINPLDSQEMKPYRNNMEIQAMTNLIQAFQNNDMNEFELIFKENQLTLMEDNFIQEHINELVTHLRKKSLLRLIKPYKTISLMFISEQLSISIENIEQLLISCILDGKISGQIDSVRNLLVMNKDLPEIDRKYVAIQKYVNQIDNLSKRIFETDLI